MPIETSGDIAGILIGSETASFHPYPLDDLSDRIKEKMMDGRSSVMEGLPQQSYVVGQIGSASSKLGNLYPSEQSDIDFLNSIDDFVSFSSKNPVELAPSCNSYDIEEYEEYLEKIRHLPEERELRCKIAVAITFRMVPSSKEYAEHSGTLSLPHAQLLTKLETLRRTSKEHRPPDADWPNAQAFEEASQFIRLLPLPDIFIPSVYIAHDGEINFLWKEEGLIHIDLGFYGDGTYSYYAINKDGQEFMSDAVETSQGLALDLEQILKA